MAAYTSPTALDAELNVIREATHLYLCSALPGTYTEATSTYALGVKATPTIGAIGDGSSGSREFAISAITDGTVSTAGTATHYALVKSSTSTLLAADALSASVALATGAAFTLNAITVNNPK